MNLDRMVCVRVCMVLLLLAGVCCVFALVVRVGSLFQQRNKTTQTTKQKVVWQKKKITQNWN